MAIMDWVHMEWTWCIIAGKPSNRLVVDMIINFVRHTIGGIVNHGMIELSVAKTMSGPSYPR